MIVAAGGLRAGSRPDDRPDEDDDRNDRWKYHPTAKMV